MIARFPATIRAAAGAVRRARRTVVSRPIVLMYHRVVDLPLDPQLLAVRPAHFEQQLELLRRRYRVISLPSLVSALREGRVPRRTVVVTLDDGYADNLSNAKPLLERHAVPATVFVASGSIGEAREFWWDELERLVLLPGVLPATMRIAVDGIDHELELGRGSRYREDDFLRDHWWHVEQDHDPGPRHRLYRRLYELVHPLPDLQRRRLLHQLRQHAGVGAKARATHRVLTEREIVDLVDGDLVDIGAHTVTHPALAGLSRGGQRDEIRSSKARLESILGRRIVSFAYPHGSYTDTTVALVREAGFASACSSDPRLIVPDSDLFRLPRVVPRDWDGDAFGRWLRDWIG